MMYRKWGSVTENLSLVRFEDHKSSLIINILIAVYIPICLYREKVCVVWKIDFSLPRSIARNNVKLDKHPLIHCNTHCFDESTFI